MICWFMGDLELWLDSRFDRVLFVGYGLGWFSGYGFCGLGFRAGQVFEW